MIMGLRLASYSCEPTCRRPYAIKRGLPVYVCVHENDLRQLARPREFTVAREEEEEEDRLADVSIEIVCENLTVSFFLRSCVFERLRLFCGLDSVESMERCGGEC